MLSLVMAADNTEINIQPLSPKRKLSSRRRKQINNDVNILWLEP